MLNGLGPAAQDLLKITNLRSQLQTNQQPVLEQERMQLASQFNYLLDNPLLHQLPRPVAH